MKLTNDEYKALEDIVGPEYITQDPVIMESYSQVWGNKLEFGQKHLPSCGDPFTVYRRRNPENCAFL